MLLIEVIWSQSPVNPKMFDDIEDRVAEVLVAPIALMEKSYLSKWQTEVHKIPVSS